MKNYMKKAISTVIGLLMLIVGICNEAPADVQAATSTSNLAERYLSTSIKYLSFDNKENTTYDFNVKKGTIKKGTNYIWAIRKNKGNPNAVTIDKKTGIVTAKQAGSAFIQCIITLPDGKTLKPEAKVIVLNNITEVDISNVPDNQTITAGNSYDFNRTILNTEAGKNKITKGITRWEIKDDTVGVESISEAGEVFPVKKGRFSIRAICFQSSGKYKLWLKDKEANNTYITASSKWFTITVQDSNGEASVKTQVELDKAIKAGLFTQVTLNTEKEGTFTINQGNYPNTNLIINAPKAEINNFAVFKNIDIKAIKDNTWSENAKGNTFQVNSLKSRVVVNEAADVKEIILESEDSIFNLEIQGIVHKITIHKPSSMNLSGKSGKLPIIIEKSGESSIVTTSVPIDVDEYGDAEFVFSLGSEGSSINKSDKAIKVKIKNDSKQAVTITTNHTDAEEVKAGESGPSIGDGQQPIVITGPIFFPGTPSGGTTNEDLSGANISVATASPVQNCSFNLTIAGAKDSSGTSITGYIKVKVSSSNSSEGTAGVVYNQATSFTNGNAAVPVTLTKKGSQTLTISITGVTALKTIIATVQADTKGAYVKDLSLSSNSSILVFFDETVDSVSAQMVDNYTLSGTFGFTGHPVKAEAIPDSNMVILTVGNMDSIVDGQTIIITVTGVKDLDGNPVDTLHNMATLKAIGVKVVDLSYVDTTHIKVSFDMAVDKATAENVINYALGGTFELSLHPSQAVLGGAGNNEVTLTVDDMSAITDGQTISVTVSYAKDLAGNSVNPFHKSFTIIIDNTGAYVTKLDYVDATHIKLCFNEQLEITSAQNAANYVLGGTFGLSGHPVNAILGGIHFNEVTLTVDDMTSIINGQTVLVTAQNVEDRAGNPVDQGHNSAQFIIDITGAYFDHLEYMDSTHLKVVFDEAVEKTTAEKVNNYTLSGTFGLAGHPSQAILGGTDSNEVTLTVSDMSGISDGESIAVTVSNVEDLAGNPVDPANDSYEIFADNSGAYVTAVNYIDNTHISVVFDEPLDIASAQNAANYTLGGTFGLTGHPSQAILGGTDNDIVILTVGNTSSINDGQTISVTVANVEDLAGNPVDQSHNNAQFVKNSKGAFVTKLEYVDTTHIKVFYDEPVDSATAQNVSNYTLGGTFGLAGYPSQAVLGGVGNNEVTLTVNNMSSIVDGQTVSVLVANVEDMTGNPVDIVNNYAGFIADNTGAYVTELDMVDTTHIKLIYSEALDANSAQDTANYTLSGTFGLTGSPSQAILGGTGNNEVTLTVGDMSTITDTQTVVVTVSNVLDLASNLVDPNHNSAEFVIDNTGASVVSVVYVDTTHLKIIFNEALNIITAQNAANYILGNALSGNPTQAVLGGMNNNEVTLTLGGLPGVSEGETISFTVSSVLDLAGNSIQPGMNYAEITMDYTGAYLSSPIQYVDATHIKLTFDEELDAASAQDVTNYTLSGTYSLTLHPVQAVLCGAGNNEVILTIGDMTSMTAGQKITVTVSNVKDLFSNPVDPGNNSADYTK